MAAATIALGVPPLDRQMPAIPTHTLLLFENDPGVEAEPFLYQATHAQLARGGRVVYLVTNRSPSAITHAMREHGFDVEPHADRLSFIDAFSALMGSDEGARYVARDPANLREILDLLDRAAADEPDAILLVDSLSTLLDRLSVPALVAAAPDLRRRMKRFRLAAALLTRWPYAEDLSALESAFDALVALKGMEDRVLFGQYLSVQRGPGVGGGEPARLLYKTRKPGGVLTYIPKVVITGPHDAGKTTFIRAVSEAGASADVRGSTVAMDHGRVTMEGLSADLFGTPGQERFDPLLQTIAGEALGVLVVVDASAPDTFPRAKEMLHRTWREGVPGLIVANKQDRPGALTPTEVARRLGAPPGVPVVGCIGRDAAEARKVLHRLFERILAQGVAA